MSTAHFQEFLVTDRSSPTPPAATLPVAADAAHRTGDALDVDGGFGV
ncbi:hypothetical protein Drose_12900 [Dactylosporangium roseum]|uniref:Uncharacterized protein n=1 Tax=Dactylosporangium roseum TaxID=47989 RepID=A0ABY5ZAB0_9ACTN|nr:hypothetical protein [Dactylosporangium roseum]UWZ39035.1 hypothetical protein Drose_12900 [Dactylosporangium roseum]